MLVQGSTSIGKTSLIRWLAAASGNHCVRINNHEHTDIQEYIGCYTSDVSGKLIFKEGRVVPLVLISGSCSFQQWLLSTIFTSATHDIWGILAVFESCSQLKRAHPSCRASQHDVLLPQIPQRWLQYIIGLKHITAVP